MLKIGIFSEKIERFEVLEHTVSTYLNERKVRFLTIPCRSYSEAAGIRFDDLLKCDLCFIDFSNLSESLRLAARMYEKRKELIWICVGASYPSLLDLLLLRPSGYIPDINNSEYINRLLGRLVQYLQMREQSEYFAFKCEGEYVKIPYSNISYFESSAKKVTLHMYNSPKKYYITAKLEDIQKAAPSTFLRCHQSYLVNMKCIRYFDIKEKKIIALPNEEVLVSRRMYMEARQIYDAYLAGKQEKGG